MSFSYFTFMIGFLIGGVFSAILSAIIWSEKMESEDKT